jgi:hypothetical protein
MSNTEKGIHSQPIFGNLLEVCNTQKTKRMENQFQYATIYHQLHQRQKFSSNNWKYFLNKNEHRKRNSWNSNIGVTLFLIAITDICKGMEDPTKMIGFTDDWIIYTSHKLPRLAEARLKKAVDKVIKWTNKNGFRISAEKTKSMFIDTINQVIGRTPRIRIWINNEEIEMKNYHRILGMILDQRLNVCLI